MHLICLWHLFVAFICGIYLWHLFGTNFQKVVVFFGVVCVYRCTYMYVIKLSLGTHVHMIRMYTQIDAGYPCVLYHLYLYCNFYTAAVPGTIKHVIVLHVVHSCTPGYICTVEPTLYAAQIDPPLPLRSIWNFIATCKFQQLIHVDNFRFL